VSAALLVVNALALVVITKSVWTLVDARRRAARAWQDSAATATDLRITRRIALLAEITRVGP
jgi:hypothetical protein